MKSIDTPVALQFLGEAFHWLTCLLRVGGDAAVHFLRVDFDFLFGRDFLQEEVGLEIHAGALSSGVKDFLLLSCDVVFGHTRADALFDELVGLVLRFVGNERFGEFEIDLLGELFEKLVGFEVAELTLNVLLELFADEAFQAFEVLLGNDRSGEFIGELGEFLNFDRLDGDVEVEVFAAEFFHGVIFLDHDADGAAVASACAFELAGKAGEEGLVVHFEPKICSFHELAGGVFDCLGEWFVLESGLVVDDGEVAFLERSIGDVFDVGEASAELLELHVDVFVLHLAVGDFEHDAFVIREFEVWSEGEISGESKGSVWIVDRFIGAGGVEDLERLLFDGLLEALADEARLEFFSDLFGVALLDHGLRSLSGTEARKAGLLAE